MKQKEVTVKHTIHKFVSDDNHDAIILQWLHLHNKILLKFKKNPKRETFSAAALINSRRRRDKLQRYAFTNEGGGQVFVSDCILYVSAVSIFAQEREQEIIQKYRNEIVIV